MKKTFTILLGTIIMVLAYTGTVFAQPGTYYKVHYMNQTFDEIDALPADWAVKTSTTSSNFSNLGRNGGIALADFTGGGKWLAFSGGGGGSRGAELIFPSTSTNANGYPADSIWNIEFDWTILTTVSALSEKNAEAIVFAGSNGVPTNNADGWYLPGVFGLYAWKDSGYMHYMNKDRDGLQKRDAEGNLLPGETNGVAFPAGNSQSWRRATSVSGLTNNVEPFGTADSLNAPSATDVIIRAGGTYHITAMLDFKRAGQKVVKLIITDIANAANTDTIEDMEFLAPTYAGTAATVAPEDRIVTDLSVMSMINTRGSNGYNGNSTNLAGSGIDNLEIYVWKESIGIADVTVNYLDQDNAIVKAARVAADQQVGSIFNLVSADKEKVVDDNFYYAYDADSTHKANEAKGDGENLTVDFADNSLTVKFKKSAKTEGTYVWTGAANSLWNELADNFSVNSGAAQSYQSGNAAAFSNAGAPNKDIEVNGTIDLGASDVSVSAAGYTFAGIGKLTGTGNFSISAATTLNLNNQLDGGIVINTTDTINIKNAAAAKGYTATVDGATLKMGVKSGEATFVGLPLTGSGGAFNLVIDSVAPHSLNLTNISDLNVKFNQEGRLKGTRWTTTLGGTIPYRSQVNVTTSKTEFSLPTGFSVQGKTLDSVKVHLGDYIRVLRDYNENNNNNDRIYIGELTGSATSYLEGGWVDGRASGYIIGSLGTDAVFDGGIRAYHKYTPATDTTTEVIAPSTSGIRLTKTGSGSWTINGIIDFPQVADKARFNSITVDGGTLVLGNKVVLSTDTVPHVIDVKNKSSLILNDSIVAPALNAMTLTVDSASTLKANDNFIGMYDININGILEDGLKAGANLNISKTAIVKLDITNFTDAYEKIVAAGDLKADSAILEITVANAPSTIGSTVQLFTSSNSDIRFKTVTVNGEAIISNGEAVPGKDYIWVYSQDDEIFTGELQYGVYTGLKDNFAGKEIKDIKYFDLTGRPVAEPDEFYHGILIKQIIYVDGTVNTEKTFINRK
ncbi:MAG: hypothetical protein JXB00_17680 [Bacteroidales bacterium]|nr:hypothetical protein [Bacteroidales bacterium]